jgi:DNA-binding PadR family transcriptional regulator
MSKKLLSPEYVLLGLLDLQPMHGYELHQRLAMELGQIWHVSLSQVYNILKRLESKDLIYGVVNTQENLPDRRILHLTESGSNHYEAWLRSPSSSSVRSIRMEMTSRLYFAFNRDPEIAHQLIHDQIQVIDDGLKILEGKLENLPTEQMFNRFGLELRIRQLNSVIEWLIECRQKLHEYKAKEKVILAR